MSFAVQFLELILLVTVSQQKDQASFSQLSPTHKAALTPSVTSQEKAVTAEIFFFSPDSNPKERESLVNSFGVGGRMQPLPSLL